MQNPLQIALALITACLLAARTLGCVESNKSACFQVSVRLHEPDLLSRLTEDLSPDNFNTTLRHTCSLFKDYQTCEKAAISQCSEHPTQTQLLDQLFQPLCSKYSVYTRHERCFQRMRRYYRTCRIKHHSQLAAMAHLPNPVFAEDRWCNITNEYTTCIFGVSALGCSMDAAASYLSIVNHTLPLAFSALGYKCQLKNPLDLARTTTPQPPSPSHRPSTPFYVSDVRYAGSRGSGHAPSVNVCTSVLLAVLTTAWLMLLPSGCR